MRKNIMAKNLRQSILRSITRYIAIVMIIALGAGIFVGLRTTKTDMVATGQKFLDEQNMFDLRLLNTYGWSEEQLEAVKQMEGVVDAEGIVTLDAIARSGNGEEGVYKLYAIPETINKVNLLGGRMPEAPNECLADGFHATDDIIGTTISVTSGNEDSTLESLTEHTFTIVGYVSTPLYMDMSRGTTTLGNGTVSTYLYLHPDAFDVDYYAEINITLPGDHTIYSEQFNTLMDDAAEVFEEAIKPLAQQRYESVRLDAEEAYAEGMAEYEDGLAEFEDGKREALVQLDQAEQELIDGQEEIDKNLQTIIDGEKQLEEAQAELDSGNLTIATSRQQLATAKAEAFSQLAQANADLLENYKTVSAAMVQVEDGLSQINDGLNQLNSGVSQLESGLEQLEMMLGLMQTLSSVVDLGVETAQTALDQAIAQVAGEQTIAQLEENLQTLKDQQAEYAAQLTEMQSQQTEYSAQLEDLKLQRTEVEEQKAQLEKTKAELEAGMKAIDDGFLELQNSQTQAENEFAAAEAKLEAAEIQAQTGQQQLDASRKELEEGRAALEQAQQELDDGWEEYRQGREEALAELADAERELKEAAAELADAKETIDSFEDPSVYALTRNTNAGYVALESNSDIVQGVSAVFPAFFLLIAALVCITTMTRMVEEERTQIGTLKALGYSNAAIIGKYLIYAGSAAVLGCGFGVLAGSVAFPLILWKVYGVMLNVTPELTLIVDWPLCTLVVAAYTGITLLVTWYCCRMCLKEVPAELIRPKPPTSGKKIFLEHLPFWNRFSFLNKVMLRNIFRYRQRLLMMLIGIGGCTALLLTGFGVRDSIADIVAFQFEEVTLYDIDVRFSDDMKQSDQDAFTEEIGPYVDQIYFYHQSSVELDHNDRSKDIVMVVADDGIENFMDFHDGDKKIGYPGIGEALLSIGTAENMGVKIGDTVTVRDTDMRSLELTISGIYDNYVQNYILLSPETAAAQWGEAPDIQMASVTVREEQDAHEASAQIMEADGVMSVTVLKDQADMVGSMLEALDMIVITVVICAGLLAVTVLYNLTNINITERIREIATIKVLGFNAGESAAYVFKENLLLSAMGSLLGLAFGYALLAFVMSQIKIDMVWMPARLLPISYVLSVIITMLLACAVDFALYFKLEKINMAEALKSVE